ncbi:MAG TPA: hypothetical protein VIH59_13765, partial [Candidatus Tectomicrobia bacterium]
MQCWREARQGRCGWELARSLLSDWRSSKETAIRIPGRGQVVHAPVAPALNVPRHVCIPHLLQDWAARTPEALAIVAPGRAPLPYGRVQKHIDNVVQTLRTMGVGRRDRV